MRELVRLLDTLSEETKRCMRCGLCQAACPLYAQTGKETLVARGKLALLNGLAQQMISDSAGVQERLTTCLMCGSCAASCPSGVKVVEIFLGGRAILAGYRGLPWDKKILFRQVLARPALFRSLLSVAAHCQRPFLRTANAVLGTVTSPLLSPMLGKRHVLPLATQAFCPQEGLDTKAGKSGLRVAFFPGCLIAHVFPRIGSAVLRVLEHHGVGVFLPPLQACCGIPTLASGDTKTSEQLLANNMRLFARQKFDFLLTACASCAFTMRKLWPAVAANWPEEKRREVEAVAARVIEISVFLVDYLRLPTPQRPAASGSGISRITYHDPCHLRKSLGIFSQPRTLLRQASRHTLVEMNGADVCCGCGGSFTLEHHDLSRQIGKAKRDNIVATGAEVVATSCPACMLQISDMLSQHGDRIVVRHAVEVYAEELS
jgi:glycolate oxidase iron-sulfur subunit